MPSWKKTVYFISSALFCAGGVAIMGYGMSDNWSRSEVTCDSGNSTGSGIVTIGLFNGEIILQSCPSLDSTLSISVMGRMMGTPLILQYIAVVLLALALIGSAGSLLITLYNSVSNPYETYMGPLGLYACASFSVVTSFLALVIFVSNVHLSKFAEEWIQEAAAFEDTSNPVVTMQVGFFLVLPYMVMNLLAILLVYLYVHGAYTHKREQLKPTDDAPKEIMMY